MQSFVIVPEVTGLPNGGRPVRIVPQHDKRALLRQRNVETVNHDLPYCYV